MKTNQEEKLKDWKKRLEELLERYFGQEPRIEEKWQEYYRAEKQIKSFIRNLLQSEKKKAEREMLERIWEMVKKNGKRR